MHLAYHKHTNYVATNINYQQGLAKVAAVLTKIIQYVHVQVHVTGQGLIQKGSTLGFPPAFVPLLQNNNQKQ